MKITKNTRDNPKKLKAVDFFCSGGGMSYGMQKAGIEIIAGIDFDINCKETYEANIIGAEFIHADVFELKEQDLEEKLSLRKNDDELVLIGCSPCQYWSLIRTNKNKSEKSKDLLKEFTRFVMYFKPGYIVVENVPGVLRRKNESGLYDLIDWLKKNGYEKPHFEIHNVNNFGVPQNRKRFTLIANRITPSEIKPVEYEGEKPKVIDFLGVKNGFPKVEPGHKDTSEFLHTVSNISSINKRRLQTMGMCMIR